MLLLYLEVLQHSVELTRTDGKGCIPTLPEKVAIMRFKRLDPLRGCFLYLFNHLGLGKSSWQCCDDVNVIGHTVRSNGFATQIAANCCQVGVHAKADGRVEPRLTILGAEDDVKDDVTEGLGHEGNMTENCVRMNRAFSANDISVNMFSPRRAVDEDRAFWR